jgi:hypothetical protein
MNIFKLLMVLVISCVAFETFAQTREESSTSAQQATTATTATVQSTTATKPKRAAVKSSPGHNTPGSISAKPSTVLTLCCGSVNAQEMTGNNCAYMAAGVGCAGYILACPNGTSDTVKESGDGYCKPD